MKRVRSNKARRIVNVTMVVLFTLTAFTVIVQQHAFKVGSVYININPTWHWQFGTETMPGYDPVLKKDTTMKITHKWFVDITEVNAKENQAGFLFR